MDAGEEFTGGDGNDIFNAFAVQTAVLPKQTLNGNDFLIGGGGRDTLNVELVNLFTQPAGLESIEVVNVLGGPDLISSLLGSLGAPSILDVINADSIDTLGFRAPVNSTTIDNLKTALDTVSISDSSLGNTYTINHIGSALDGLNDILDINLSNVSLSLLSPNETTLELDGNGGTYETANINSGGTVDNALELGDVGGGSASATAGAFTTINVSGAQNLTIKGSSLDLGSLETFDARNLNADLDATFAWGTDAAKEISLVGAQGDTVFTIAHTTGDVDVETFGGDDFINVFNHTGDMAVDAGEGKNKIKLVDVAGNAVASAGAGDDTFEFDIVTGDVEVNGGNGKNDYTFTAITGDVDATGGNGVDTFRFVSDGVNADATFGPNDSVDGGGGDDVLIIEVEGTNNLDLLVAGVGPNINGVETIRHEGDLPNSAGNNLMVDWGRSGSATRLELAGSYGDDVRVEGLNYNVGDVVVVLSDIGDELELTQAASTPGAYNLELGGGVTIDELHVGDGTSDLININSVGDGKNVITEVDDVDAQVTITGDTDLQFGSESDAYDLDNGLVDTTGFSGTATVFLGDGNQTFTGGNGDDVVWSIESGLSDKNTIELGDGVNTVGFVETAASQNIADQHHVTGFTVGVDKLDLYVGAGGFTLDATDNSSVSAGDALNVETISKGQLVSLAGSDVNFLKFTESVSGETTVDGLFDAAIGTGVINVSYSADVLGAVYDDDSGSMVIFQVDNASNLGGGVITAADTAEGIASIEMSYDEFTDFGNNSEDLSFVNNYA